MLGKVMHYSGTFFGQLSNLGRRRRISPVIAEVYLLWPTPIMIVRIISQAPGSLLQESSGYVILWINILEL